MLIIIPTPFPLPAFTIRPHWHARFHPDPENRWLRGSIAESMSEMGSDAAAL
jgi:hypothetical protein